MDETVVEPAVVAGLVAVAGGFNVDVAEGAVVAVGEGGRVAVADGAVVAVGEGGTVAVGTGVIVGAVVAVADGNGVGVGTEAQPPKPKAKMQTNKPMHANRITSFMIFLVANIRVGNAECLSVQKQKGIHYLTKLGGRTAGFSLIAEPHYTNLSLYGFGSVNR